MIHEVDLAGETAETRALEGIDRSSDGTLRFSRAHSAEQELVRDGLEIREYAYDGPSGRASLLINASAAPPLLRGWSITPLDDRLLVEYASFKEGYVCEACQGSGMSKIPCATCQGTKKQEIKPGRFEACDRCRIVGADAHEPSSCGFYPCVGCNGSGLAPGILAMPDSSKQDHSYGDILAVGQSVMDLRPGDRVVFSKMAGIYLKGDTRNCCLLRRGEIMGLMVKKG
jgi:co-chaperonin GroES (HSP10)